MTPVLERASSEYISGRQACAILECASSSLQRMALLGQVRTDLKPGVPIRYHKGDVEKLKAAQSQTATAGG
jgi:hypothetical protein